MTTQDIIQFLEYLKPWVMGADKRKQIDEFINRLRRTII